MRRLSSVQVQEQPAPPSPSPPYPPPRLRTPSDTLSHLKPAQARAPPTTGHEASVAGANRRAGRVGPRSQWEWRSAGTRELMGGCRSRGNEAPNGGATHGPLGTPALGSTRSFGTASIRRGRSSAARAAASPASCATAGGHDPASASRVSPHCGTGHKQDTDAN